MIQYYHRHLPNIATQLEPLHSLLRKGVAWKWADKQQDAFESITDRRQFADSL